MRVASDEVKGTDPRLVREVLRICPGFLLAESRTNYSSFLLRKWVQYQHCLVD